VRRRLIGLAALAALSGCWFQPGFDGANTRNNSLEQNLTAARVPGLTEAWSTNIDAIEVSEPIVSGGRIYVEARHPANFLGIKTFDAATGAPGWAAQVAGARGGASPVSLIDDQLWLAHTPGFCATSGVTRFDPVTGAQTGHEEGLAGGPVIGGSSLVAYTVNIACDPSAPSTLLVRHQGSLDPAWSYTFPAPGLPTAAAIAGSRLYIGLGPTLYAFDTACASPCTPLWTRSFSGTSLDRPTVGPNGRVYVVVHTATGDDTHDLNPANGQSYGHAQWPEITVGVTGGSKIEAVTLGEGTDRLAGVAWLDPDYTSPSGASQGACSIGGSYVTGLAVAGNVIYLTTAPSSGTGDGHVVALSATPPESSGGTCEPLKSLTVHGTPTGISVAGGQVLVTSTTGSLAQALTAYSVP